MEAMAWEDVTVRALKDNGVDTVAYLPDSVLAPLVERIEADDELEAVLVAREEEAVGLLSGVWLGGGRGALVCQTSGLANTFNALGSLAKPVGLPFLGLVTRRGDLAEHNLAQAPAGYAMPALLDDIGVRNHGLTREGMVEEYVGMAARTVFAQEEPYVLFLEPGLTGGK